MKTNEYKKDHEILFCPDCKNNNKYPLVFDTKTSWGDIYNCEICYQPWIKVIPEFNSHWLQRFNGKMQLMLEKFTVQNIQIKNEHYHFLKNEIKAMPNKADEKVYPASVAFKDGRRFKKTKIILANPLELDMYLHDTNLSDIHFVDEIESIEKSEFALSLECRNAIHNAPAYHQCNPSYLICDKGHIIRFEGQGDFVSFEQAGEYILRPFTDIGLNPSTEMKYPMSSTSIEYDVIIIGLVPLFD